MFYAFIYSNRWKPPPTALQELGEKVESEIWATYQDKNALALNSYL